MRLKLDANAGTVRVARFLFMHGNEAGVTAGGLYISSESSDGTPVTVEGNAFFENVSQVGAALEVLTSGATLAVVNNLFLLNEAGTDESATYLADSGNQPTTIAFTNNTVISNHLGQSAAGTAKAVYFVADRILVVNNNFWDNDGFDLDAGLTGIRSIYNNNYESVLLHGSEDVQDNISVAPEYGGGFLDFTPARGSALVDAGRDPPGVDSGWYLADLDLNGAQRKVGSRIDIGAFENERIFFYGFDAGGFFRGVE